MRYEATDTDNNRCQCVRSHSTMKDNEIPQCDSRRAAGSNLFCKNCEELHGEAVMHAKANAEAKGKADPTLT